MTLAASVTSYACDSATPADGGPTPGTDGGTAPMDGCVTELAVVCDGDELSVRDLCTGVTTVVESCTGTCYLGACVDCAPAAGRLCVGAEVRDINSCGTIGDVVESCSGECRAGGCVGSECTSGAATRCVGNTLYTEDSCGNLENALRVCADGCAAGACIDEICTPDTGIACYRGDLYNFDSCLTPGTLFMDCPEACNRDTNECEAGACTPTSFVTCFLGNMHVVDSCGVTDEIAEDCPSGCDGSGCLACVPAPVGRVCSDGDVHELIGGCPGTPTSVGDLAESCEFGCSGGGCLTSSCIPDVGTVCSGGDVHVIDSCGVIGALLSACTAGCSMGACSMADGGAPDAGAPDAGGSACACAPSEVGNPFSCNIGEIRCTGCFGFDDFCDDESACLSQCAGEFTCSDNTARLDGVTIASCDFCPEDCSAPTLCGAVCASAP